MWLSEIPRCSVAYSSLAIRAPCSVGGRPRHSWRYRYGTRESSRVIARAAIAALICAPVWMPAGFARAAGYQKSLRIVENQ